MWMRLFNKEEESDQNEKEVSEKKSHRAVMWLLKTL
jgi:hypothetical protein